MTEIPTPPSGPPSAGSTATGCRGSSRRSRPPYAAGSPVRHLVRVGALALVAAVVVGRRRRLVARLELAGPRLGRDRRSPSWSAPGRSGRSTAPRSSAGPRGGRSARSGCSSRWPRGRCRCCCSSSPSSSSTPRSGGSPRRSTAGCMWQAVLLFAVIGVGFLLARLPEEMEEYDADLTAERVVAACAGTPVESAAAELEITEEMLERHSDVVGFERGNLVLVLLIAQAIQVLLLVGRGLGVLPGVRDRRDRRRRDRGVGRRPAPLRRGVRPGEPRARPGLDLPRGVRRPLLHGLRRHRRQLPQAVLHPDPPRARAGRQRAAGLPVPAGGRRVDGSSTDRG